MAFVTVALAELVFVFACRSETQFAWHAPWNGYLVLGVLASAAIVAAIVYVPFLRSPFATVPLGAVELIVAAGLALVPAAESSWRRCCGAAGCRRRSRPLHDASRARQAAAGRRPAALAVEQPRQLGADFDHAGTSGTRFSAARPRTPCRPGRAEHLAALDLDHQAVGGDPEHSPCDIVTDLACDLLVAPGEKPDEVGSVTIPADRPSSTTGRRSTPRSTIVRAASVTGIPASTVIAAPSSPRPPCGRAASRCPARSPCRRARRRASDTCCGPPCFTSIGSLSTPRTVPSASHAGTPEMPRCVSPSPRP